MQMQKQDLTFDQFIVNFKLSIPTYNEKEAVYFNISMSIKDGKSWGISRKFQEFENLHSVLTKITVVIPTLPAKTLLFKLSNEEVEERRKGLEEYLQTIIKRQDIMATKQLQDFLNIIDKVPDQISTNEVAKLQNHDKPVVDIIYLEEDDILFVLTSKINIETKMKGFFQSLVGNENKTESWGSLLVYKKKQTFNTSKNQKKVEFEFDLLWEKRLYSSPTCMVWDQGLTILAIGHTNGNIEVVRIHTERNYSKYDDYCLLKKHTKEITGLAFDSSTALLYSSSLDKALMSTSMTNIENQKNHEEILTQHPLTALSFDKPNKALYVGNSQGTIVIVRADDKKFKIVHEIKPQSINPINSLHIYKSRFLFAGSSQYLKVFELKKPKKESQTEIKICIVVESPVNGMGFDFEHREVFMIHNNSVIIFYSVTGLPIKTLLIHYEKINKLIYLENKRLLITCGSDFQIKFTKIDHEGDKEEEQVQQSDNQNEEQEEEQKNNFRNTKEQRKKQQQEEQLINEQQQELKQKQDKQQQNQNYKTNNQQLQEIDLDSIKKNQNSVKQNQKKQQHKDNEEDEDDDEIIISTKKSKKENTQNQKSSNDSPKSEKLKPLIFPNKNENQEETQQNKSKKQQQKYKNDDDSDENESDLAGWNQ